MKATVISKSGTSVTISVTIPLGSSMLEGEEIIQEAVNRVGSETTIELFSRFDTDGSPIRIGGTKYTSKGQVEKTYQSPYGSIRVARHVYQRSDGGATYCPLEVNARTLGTSTPKFAMQLSSKYSRIGVTQVQADLEENHGRSITKVMIQSVSKRVANAIESKHDYWTYDDTADSESVASVSIGMDGYLHING